MLMKLSKVYETLSASEVFTYDMADENGNILPKFRRRVTTLINSGLSDLYQRFSIKEGVIELEVTEDKQHYILSDGVLEVLRMTTPEGKVYNLNSVTSQLSPSKGPYGNVSNNPVHTALCHASYNELFFSHVPSPGVYRIVYKGDATHISLDGIDTADPKTIEIPLPLTYLNALCYYVAAKVYNPAGAQSVARSMFHEGNNWRSMYEDECNRLKANLAGAKSFNEVSNFTRGGWV